MNRQLNVFIRDPLPYIRDAFCKVVDEAAQSFKIVVGRGDARSQDFIQIIQIDFSVKNIDSVFKKRVELLFPLVIFTADIPTKIRLSQKNDPSLSPHQERGRSLCF